MNGKRTKSSCPKRHAILIVDDDPRVLKALARVLEGDGYQVLTAESGEEGLRRLRTRQVDLILSDHKMSGMTGSDFLRSARREFPDVPRIMLTGQADRKATEEVIREIGVFAFLFKPWSHVELRLAVRRALEHRVLVMERNLLAHQVEERDRILSELERAHPGITMVGRPSGSRPG